MKRLLHFVSQRDIACLPVLFVLFACTSWSIALAEGPARPKAIQRQPQTAPAEPVAEPEKSPVVYETLVNGVAYLEARAANEQTWSGTGWLVDRERRLMITNMHVVAATDKKELKSVIGWFPVMKDDEAIHDIDYYQQHAPKIAATIIYTDAMRDLALVQVESLPQNAVPFKLAAKSAPVGSLLHSLGGLPRGSQGMFIYTQGTSRAVYKRGLAQGGPIQVLETQMPLNQGNSGGPIVNDKGEVVAVFEGLVIEQGVQLVNMSIDISEVRTFLEAALPHVDPQTATALNARGDLHYEAGRYNAALADFNAALKQDPKFAEAISSRGWVNYLKGDAETALAEFDAALAIKPTLHYAQWGRATIHRDKLEYDQALADFTQAIRHTDYDPDLANLYNERGNTHYGAEDYKAALADYDRAIAKKPDLAWGHCNRGDALAQLQRYDEAFPAIDKAISLDKKEARFWNVAGNVWFARERYDFAVNMYGSAINIDPTSAQYYRNRGGAQRLAGQYQNAASDLVKALELAPGEHEYWNELGLVWFEIERYDNALVAFSEAIKLEGDSSTYYGNRGHSYYHQTLYAEAIADLTKAIAGEDAALYRKLRGESHQHLGNHAKAKADFARAVELDSEYKLHDRKYLQITNNTDLELTIYVRYYTLGTDDDWHWYPAPPGEGEPLSFTYGPGETAYPTHKDRYIKAERARVWAEGGGKEWTAWKDSSVILAPDSGYLSTSEDQATETVSFGGN